MIDRLLDLFAGFNTSKGPEKRLSTVIMNNLSAKFFIELMISFGPLFFGDVASMNTLYYVIFKIPRYGRLFEMDS